MAEKKHTSFALLQILEEESDENHILNASQLAEKLDQRLNVRVERRTIYSNIEILRQAGYEISDYNENGKGYYLKKRQFEKGEILLLCNAIHASHFIAAKDSEILINKLLSTLSKEDRKEFTDSVYMPNPLKSQSEYLFDNISTISSAVHQGHKISFTYTRYSRNKQLVPRRKEPYIVEPRYIVYNDSRPYLITTSEKHPGFTHWRIDKIRNIRILDERIRQLKKAEETEAYRYAANKLFMFSGETEYVSFRCEERIMDQMIDIFGPEMRILSDSDGFFTARVSTTESGALFLAQQFLDAIEIIDPVSLRERFNENLKKRLGGE
ncbi:MAG: WYL domain-containing protein [Erysipelotrichaceae bacterium]|nr:WYL domain-containing protein [Erysipelotrichaceae bacterium]